MLKILSAVLLGLLVSITTPAMASSFSPWLATVKPRTLAEFHSMLSTGNGLKAGVTPELYARELGDKVNIPSTRQGILDFFNPSLNKHIVVVQCTEDLLKKVKVGGVNVEGNTVAVVYGDRRQRCYREEVKKGGVTRELVEHWLAYRNPDGSLIYLGSLWCGNTLQGEEPAPSPPPVTTTTAVATPRPAVMPCKGCKTLVYHIFPQAIEHAVSGIRELQAKALSSPSFKGDRVSRNKCGEMRRQATKSGGVLHSSRRHPVKISVVKLNGEKVVSEMDLYTTIVSGFVHIPIPKRAEEFGWDAIRIVHYDPARTPATYEGSGLAETRFFDDEWDPLELVMNACAVEYEEALVVVRD